MDFKQASNMKQLLRILEQTKGKNILFQYMNNSDVIRVSASDFFDQVRKFAARLQQEKMVGVHIGIMGENSPQWLANLCAVFMVGSVAVLLSPELSAKKLAEQVQQTDIRCILCDSHLLGTANAASIPGYDLNEPSNAVFEEDDCICPSSDDLACIVFTSGTTALNKAVMFSHKAMLAGTLHNILGNSFQALLVILPLYHIAGLMTVLNTWYLGCTLCLGTDIRHIYRYLDVMKPDFLLVVPSILRVILKKQKKANWNLRIIACGGTEFPMDLVPSCVCSNIQVIQVYGATEVGGIGLYCDITSDFDGALGKANSMLDAKIVNGELYLKSESLMSGYYKDSQGTSEALVDGWYATGDLCEQDANGYLYLKGRKKNLIILDNGENVSPEQIEQELKGNTVIEEIMVGLQGKLITAFILPKSQDSQHQIEQSVLDYNLNVPRYMQIQNICYMNEPFAKTAIGKQIRHSVTGGDKIDS